MSATQLPPQYLRGIELFNAARFYEAHEVWEEIWLTASGADRQLLHALIQTAAALLHVQRGNLKGAASVWQRARTKLNLVPQEMRGLSVRQLNQACETFFSAASESQFSGLKYPTIQIQLQFRTGQAEIPEED
jgi:predicted metal-dependent hydrolase